MPTDDPAVRRFANVCGKYGLIADEDYVPYTQFFQWFMYDPRTEIQSDSFLTVHEIRRMSDDELESHVLKFFYEVKFL